MSETLRRALHVERVERLDADDRPWYVEGRFLGAVGFLVLVAIIGALVLIRDDSSSSTAVKSTPPPSAVPSIPTAAPSGTTWSLWYGIALPSLPGSPASIDKDVPSGFAHTPEGALIAASQLGYRLGWGSSWREVSEQFAVGPHRDAFLAALRSWDGDHTDTSNTAQLAGFKYVSYGDDQAVLKLATGSASNYRIGTYKLSWQDGDWRVQISPSNEVADYVEAADLIGFAKWTGVAR